MQQIVIFSLLIGSVFAAPQHLIAAPLAAPVVAAAPAAVAVHHPAVINTHLAPAAAVVQTPTLSGYSFTSEVRHAAPLIAAAAPIVAAHAPLIAHHAPVLAAPAPVVAAAPVVHAAPVVAAAPVVHAAAPLLAPATYSKTYSVETGHLVSGTAVAHAPLVAPALAAPVVHAAAPVVHAAAPLFAHLKAKA